MKVRHQIMILLAVPIVCQLATVVVLLRSVEGVDNALRKEQNAKDIISSLSEIDGLAGHCILARAGSTFGATDNSAVTLTLLPQKWVKVKKMVRDNKQATQIVRNLNEEIDRFILNLSDMKPYFVDGQPKIFSAQFYDRNEFAESMLVNYDQIAKDSEHLRAIYQPMTQELGPEAVTARSNLRSAVTAVIVASLMLVSAMAIAVNKRTLSRLQVLMSNIRTFSRGEKTLEALRGTDELAELDIAFREMSQQKFRLDEIQNSLRAMVSHDLRAPLTSMILSLELILDWGEDNQIDEKTIKSLRRIHWETQRLARLARTLLDIEKLEGGNIKVDLAEVSWQAIVELSISAVNAQADRKEIRIEQSIPPESTINCDEDRTIQCVVNLLSNAIKFSPKGSLVKVQVREEADWMRLEVIDEGPGVPESKISSLFTKFVQLGQPEATKLEGSGLGLYICRLLIEAQNGRVGYCSAGETGSCFYFELPSLPIG